MVVIHLNATRRFAGQMLLGLAVVLGWASSGEDHSCPECQVKAASLLNLRNFVEWPAATFASTNTPFIVGILGDDVFAQKLEKNVRLENVRGHPLVVKRCKPGEELPACQILFLGASQSDNLESIVNSLKGHPVLTVSSVEGAAARGVMVNLLIVHGSVKMEINQDQAEGAQLRISSKLLGLAKIIEQ